MGADDISQQSTARKVGQVAVTTGIFIAFIATISAFFRPVLTGLLLALVLTPPTKRFIQGRRIGPRQASAISTLLFCLFVLLPITGVIFMLLEDGAALMTELRDWLTKPNRLNEILDQIQAGIPGRVPRAEILEQGSKLAEQAAKTMIAFGASVAGSLPLFLFDMAMLILTLYYGLADGEILVKKLRQYLPFGRVTNDRILETGEKTVRGGIVGAVLSAIAQAIVIWLGFIILGVPNSTVAGLGTFFTSFVPILGAMPAGLAGVIYLLIQGSVLKALLMVLFFFAAGTVDNIIKPVVLSDSVDLHPMLGLLSALGGLAIMGFIGIFVGPLVTALALELISVFEEMDTLST